MHLIPSHCQQRIPSHAQRSSHNEPKWCLREEFNKTSDDSHRPWNLSLLTRTLLLPAFCCVHKEKQVQYIGIMCDEMTSTPSFFSTYFCSMHGQENKVNCALISKHTTICFGESISYFVVN